MITIREAVRQDIEGLGELLFQLIGNRSEPRQMKLVFDKMQNDESYILLVAEYEQKIVGSIMGIICYDLAEACKPFMVVENVITDESKRGMGIGKYLMCALEEKAKSHEVTYMMLVSAASRQGAHRFYEAMGYRQDNVVGFKKHL